MPWKDTAVINRISLIWLHRAEPKSKQAVRCFINTQEKLVAVRSKGSTISDLFLAVFYVEARENIIHYIYKVVFLRKAPVWEHLTRSEQELVLKPFSMCWVNKPTPSKNTQIP